MKEEGDAKEEGGDEENEAVDEEEGGDEEEEDEDEEEEEEDDEDEEAVSVGVPTLNSEFICSQQVVKRLRLTGFVLRRVVPGNAEGEAVFILSSKKRQVSMKKRKKGMRTKTNWPSLALRCTLMIWMLCLWALKLTTADIDNSTVSVNSKRAWTPKSKHRCLKNAMVGTVLLRPTLSLFRSDSFFPVSTTLAFGVCVAKPARSERLCFRFRNALKSDPLARENQSGLFLPLNEEVP